MTRQTPLAERTIGEYLSTLGSSNPAPGGGSVAGLVGALACGLAQMVINLTIKGSPSPLLDARFSKLTSSIESLLASAVDDELAYGGYVAATRLPKGSDDEKAARRAAMQEALCNAAEVPLALAETACEVLSLIMPVAAQGTTHALSDVDISISLAHASVLAGLVNVRINIPLIKDVDVSSQLAARADAIESLAHQRADALRGMLKARRDA